MSEKRDLIVDLHRQADREAKERQRQIARLGPRAGRGLEQECVRCGKRYGLVGVRGEVLPPCPYCGAAQ
jgi:hypothetical protein